MKKLIYEYLYSEIYKLYAEMDDTAGRLCFLKRRLNEMGTVLENEYKSKYKTSFKKRIYNTNESCKSADTGSN